MNYCLGFLTNPEANHVLLMEKHRPAWQAGRLNGIGGKPEGDEASVQAMERECLEETGLEVADWTAMGPSRPREAPSCGVGDWFFRFCY